MYLKWLNAWRNNIQRPNSVYTLQWYCIKRTNSVYSYIQYVLCEGFPSSPFHFFCSSEFYRSIAHCSQKYPLAAWSRWVTWWHDKRRVRLEAALCRMITVWHQSTARAIWMHRIRLLSYSSRGTLMSHGDHSARAASSRTHLTKQRSRGGAAMFAYEMWKERNIRPQTCLHFDKCIKQCIKCIGEKINRKYRSYQASIDPIPIPTLVSILSIFGSIRPPLLNAA